MRVRLPKNWRTTLAGVGAIAAALGDLIAQFTTKDWDATRLGADATGLFTGFGLIFARDAVVSEQEHHEDRQKLVATQAVVEKVADKVL